MTAKEWGVVGVVAVAVAGIIGGVEYSRYSDRKSAQIESAEVRRIEELQDAGATRLSSGELRELLDRQAKREADRVSERIR